MKLDPRAYRVAGLLAWLLLILLPLGAGAAYVALKHQWGQTQLSQLEPRYARLLGLEKQHEQIEDAVDQSEQLVSLYVYPASQDASQVGNDAQRRIRDFFSKSGLEVVSSQVLPAKQDKQFDRIPITVRFEGEMVPLQTAMVAINSQVVPALLLDGMTVQVLSYAKPDAPVRLTGQLNFFVLRANP